MQQIKSQVVVPVLVVYRKVCTDSLLNSIAMDKWWNETYTTSTHIEHTLHQCEPSIDIQKELQ